MPAKLIATTNGEAPIECPYQLLLLGCSQGRLTSAGRTLRSPDQPIIVTRHGHPKSQDSDNVEERNPNKRLLHGNRYVLPRIWRLAKRHANNLSASKSKAGLAHARPPADEPA